MEYVLGFFAVGTVALLGAMSPGPDFAMVVKNAVVGSRRSGIATALGVACGCLVHVTYSIIGIGALVASSILAFTVIKWLGALYLLYLGITMLVSKGEGMPRATSARADKSFRTSFKEGFLTNALNPKATLFFLAIFTQVVRIDTPLSIKTAYGLELAILVGVWFTMLTLFLNISWFKALIARGMKHIEQVMGAVLIALACSVVLERR